MLSVLTMTRCIFKPFLANCRRRVDDPSVAHMGTARVARCRPVAPRPCTTCDLARQSTYATALCTRATRSIVTFTGRSPWTTATARSGGRSICGRWIPSGFGFKFELEPVGYCSQSGGRAVRYTSCSKSRRAAWIVVASRAGRTGDR